MKRVHIVLILFIVLAFFVSQTSLCGELTEIAPASDETAVVHPLISYDFADKDIDYTESQLRRFEIVFLISLPVSLLFTYLGIQAHRLVDGRSGKFSSMEYRYLVFSSVGISFTIALKDNRITYKKSEF